MVPKPWLELSLCLGLSNHSFRDEKVIKVLGVCATEWHKSHILAFNSILKQGTFIEFAQDAQHWIRYCGHYETSHLPLLFCKHIPLLSK